MMSTQIAQAEPPTVFVVDDGSLSRQSVRPLMIFVTDCADAPITVDAMKAGAVEFLSRPFDEDVLLGAIRHAIERSRAALGDADELRLLRQRHSMLTPRELEVMTLVVAGLLNKQIAGELGLSLITVKAHRGRVMRKMKARSLASLVHMAASLGLPRPRR